jgi:hypothetical protein
MTETERLLNAEEYAVKLIADGGESTAEDDLNEDGECDDAEHDRAVVLACAMAWTIGNNANSFLAWVTPLLPPWADLGAHEEEGVPNL